MQDAEQIKKERADSKHTLRTHNNTAAMIERERENENENERGGKTVNRWKKRVG